MFPRQLSPSCRRQLFECHRSLATEASPSRPSTSSSPATSLARPLLQTAIILNRSPILTRTPSVFERAYYAYQARIHRALQNPFPHDFYFKQGSPLEIKFNMEERQRERSAFGKPFGVEQYTQHGEEDKASDGLDELLGQEDDEEGQPRVHQADIKGNVRSLDRKGQRNVYLVVRENGHNVWRFPQGDVKQGELLHQAAERDLYTECGSHMDAWIVSRTPVGVYEPSIISSADGQSSERVVTFFYKAHILSGQVRLDNKRLHDYAWLSKQEIEAQVDNSYWHAVKDMLSDF